MVRQPSIWEAMQADAVGIFIHQLTPDGTDKNWRARSKGRHFDGTWEQCWDWIQKEIARIRAERRAAKKADQG